MAFFPSKRTTKPTIFTVVTQPSLPATSNSTSSVTLLLMAQSRRSWLVSSSVLSSVRIPLIVRILSPTCSKPHLPDTATKAHQLSCPLQEASEIEFQVHDIRMLVKLFSICSRLLPNLLRFTRHKSVA